VTENASLFLLSPFSFFRWHSFRGNITCTRDARQSAPGERQRGFSLRFGGTAKFRGVLKNFGRLARYASCATVRARLIYLTMPRDPRTPNFSIEIKGGGPRFPFSLSLSLSSLFFSDCRDGTFNLPECRVM